MIAIPISTQDATTISDLYGKAPYFALLDHCSGEFSVVKNKVKGEGPKSAEYLKSLGVDSTIFYHMGEGVYKSFDKNDMDVYSSEHSYLTIDEIYLSFRKEELTKLNDSNYDKLLDPGVGQSCTCGCE